MQLPEDTDELLLRQAHRPVSSTTRSRTASARGASTCGTDLASPLPALAQDDRGALEP